MNFVIGILCFLFVLFLVIGIHELGHACVAKFFGIKIHAISIGLGRPLITWQTKTFKWVLSQIPIGGYVALYNTRNMSVQAKDRPYCFDQKPIFIRLIVLVSGSLMNLFAAFIFFLGAQCVGYEQHPPLIEKIIPNSIAESAGLKPQDKIIKINTEKTPSWEHVNFNLITHIGDSKVHIEAVDKYGSQSNLTLNLNVIPISKENFLESIGIIPNLDPTQRVNVPPLPLKSAVYQTIVEWFNNIKANIILLKLLISGALPISILVGPFSLTLILAWSLKQGWVAFCLTQGLLNISVGVLNLIPFPGLDGGQILYCFIEKLRNKPLSIALEVLLHRLGRVALFLLFIHLCVNDLERLINKLRYV